MVKQTFYTLRWYGVAALLALCGFASMCPASIMLPEFPEVDVEQLLAEADGGTAPTGASSNHQDEAQPAAPNSIPTHNSYNQNCNALALPFLPGATSGAGAGSAFASSISLDFAHSSAFVMPDGGNFSGWLPGQASLEIPAAPGSDLLRPPQHRSRAMNV